MKDVNLEEANSLAYFMEEKGDPSRYCNFEKVCNKCPALQKAWTDYKASEQILQFVIQGLKTKAKE